MCHSIKVNPTLFVNRRITLVDIDEYAFKRRNSTSRSDDRRFRIKKKCLGDKRAGRHLPHPPPHRRQRPGRLWPMAGMLLAYKWFSINTVVREHNNQCKLDQKHPIRNVPQPGLSCGERKPRICRSTMPWDSACKVPKRGSSHRPRHT